MSGEIKIPKVFISYSWDSDEHKKWTLSLASKLRADGVDVTFDLWHLAPGDQLSEFMENAVRENEYILIVCTPNYKKKSDDRSGGVGHEGTIMTAELNALRNERKFIPLLRHAVWKEAAPSWLIGKLHIDLTEKSFDTGYQQLLDTLLNRRLQPPPIGKRLEVAEPPNDENINLEVAEPLKDENTNTDLKLANTDISTKHFECHIHENVANHEIESIHRNVCVNDLPFFKHTDGKYYCLFHLPTKDKNIEEFEKIFQMRLISIKEQVTDFEKLSGELPKNVRDDFSYDFRYVWFPSAVDLKDYKFEVTADFSSTTFSSAAYFKSSSFLNNAYFNLAAFLDNANFISTAFSGEADFRSVTFAGDADFASATFSANTSFSSTKFSSYTSFDSAKFSGYAFFGSSVFASNVGFRSAKFSDKADFRAITFSDITDFRSTIFMDVADFSSSAFRESSQTLFYQTKFHKSLLFRYTILEGYLSFEASEDKNIFLDDSFLDLQNARIEKPERVSFQGVSLRPNWFVNVDLRKITFIDVSWWSHSRSNYSAIKTEIESLKERNVHAPNRVLSIAYIKLAINAEENNRYAEASWFRLLSNELKRLELPRLRRFSSLHWWYWLSSYYGESWIRGAVVLFYILSFFALLYSQTNFQICSTIVPSSVIISENDCYIGKPSIVEAVKHSLTTATFQSVAHRTPITNMGEILVLLEKIIVPLQVLFLALAVRRKFIH